MAKESKKAVAFKRLRGSVLKKISPSAAEAREEKNFALALSERLAHALKGGASIEFVGSAARDTGLRGDKDVDLFVLFPRRLSRKQIVETMVKAVKKAIKADWIMHYAEHPYLRARVSDYDVEVIPCFETEPHQELKSAVDRSPLHMRYLQERLSAQQKEDVRLLKQFLKNAGLYGAELRISGFSGLVCEYLILNYRNFWGLVNNAREWRPPAVIDLEGFYEKQAHGFAEPLVIVDAIDRSRNAAAVVSETNLYRFISLCRAFCEKPNARFFFNKPKKHSLNELKHAFRQRGTEFLLIRSENPRVVEDILYPQLYKTLSSLRKHLEISGFRVFGGTAFADEKHCFILLEFASLERLPFSRLSGPPVSDEKACARFVKAHRNALRGPFVEGGRLFVEEARKENNALDFLKRVLASPERYGIGSFLQKPLKHAVFAIRDKIFRVSPEALDEIRGYFFKKEFWL